MHAVVPYTRMYYVSISHYIIIIIIMYIVCVSVCVE